MKRLTTFIIASIAIIGVANAENLDSLRIVQLEEQMRQLDLKYQSILDENKQLRSRMESNAASIRELESSARETSESLTKVADELGIKISETTDFAKNKTEELSQKTEDVKKGLRSSSIIATIVGIVLASLLALFYLVFRKRLSTGRKNIEKIAAGQKALQEESVKLDSQLISILESQTVAPSLSTDQDHKLVISVANELARIDQNLAHMDSSVKGVTQLKHRADAIRTTLNARGYEMPTLLGTSFHEGYNMIATMELDEDLEPGTQIIRRVIKPQINYNGKLIQAAEVVVAFNE